MEIAQAPRVWVEAWAPEYGPSFDAADDVNGQPEQDVDTEVEGVAWVPVSPERTPRPPIDFVDGVSRVDARLALETERAPTPGICGSVAVGVVHTKHGAAARFGEHTVKRATIFAAGQAIGPITFPNAMSYEGRSVPGPQSRDTVRGLETFREEVEVAFATRLAANSNDNIVVADGRMRVRGPSDIVGFVKSHDRHYLDTDEEAIVPALQPGQRTPLFAFRDFYSCYLRLPTQGHPWAGIARLEMNSSMGLARAVTVADQLGYHLPTFSSKEFWDARAPQNLVPIATLERRLRHLLGERDLVYRSLRSALASSRGEVYV